MDDAHPNASPVGRRGGRVSFGIAIVLASGGVSMQILALYEFQQTWSALGPDSRKPPFLDMDLFGYGVLLLLGGVAVLLAGGLSLGGFLDRTHLRRANGRFLVTIAILQSIFVLTLLGLLLGIDRRAAETPAAGDSSIPWNEPDDHGTLA